MNHQPSRFALPAALIAVTLLSSCATILSEKTYPVTFHTTPPGGEVSITNKAGAEVYQGSTPVTISLPAGKSYFSGETYDIRATMAGFPTASATLDTTIDGWYIGNILFGGVIGLLFVDPLTGAMYKLDDSFLVDLEPPPALTEGTAPDPDTFN